MKHYFPEPDRVGPFGPAFFRLMFTYGDLERRIADLQTLITGDPNYSQKNVWGVTERKSKMRALIRRSKNLTIAPDKAEHIPNALKRAEKPSLLRNLIVHGHWWKLDEETQTLTIRRSKIGRGQRSLVDTTVHEIDDATEQLADIEVELYKLSAGIRRKEGSN
jgi:hypothetical protein